MTNFDLLQQMPLGSFANMVFSITRNDCQNLEEFESFLRKEVPKNLEETAKKALQNLQCPDK